MGETRRKFGKDFREGAVTARNHAGRWTHLQAPAIYQEITTANGTVSR